MSSNEMINSNTGTAPGGPSAEDFIRWGQQPNVLMAIKTPQLGFSSDVEAGSGDNGAHKTEFSPFPRKDIGRYAGEQVVMTVANSR